MKKYNLLQKGNLKKETVYNQTNYYRNTIDGMFNSF